MKNDDKKNKPEEKGLDRIVISPGDKKINFFDLGKDSDTEGEKDEEFKNKEG